MPEMTCTTLFVTGSITVTESPALFVTYMRDVPAAIGRVTPQTIIGTIAKASNRLFRVMFSTPFATTLIPREELQRNHHFSFWPRTQSASVCQSGSPWRFELPPAGMECIAARFRGQWMPQQRAAEWVARSYQLRDRFEIALRPLFGPIRAARRQLGQLQRVIRFFVAHVASANGSAFSSGKWARRESFKNS